LVFCGPEIRFGGVTYFTGSATAIQAFQVTRKPSRKEAKDAYSFTQDLYRWYFEGSNTSNGPNFYIQSSEIDDSGTTVKFTVSVTAGQKDGPISGTAGFEITYTAQDKRMLGRLINYQDPITEALSDDLIFSRMSERYIKQHTFKKAKYYEEY
jgi:hypothetical protein